jgi:hypothetical protein
MRIVTKYIIDIFPGMYLWYLEANTIAYKILWALIWDTSYTNPQPSFIFGEILCRLL